VRLPDYVGIYTTLGDLLKEASAFHGRNKSFTLFTSFESKNLPATNEPPVETCLYWSNIGFLTLTICLRQTIQIDSM
jgi:hypothetical protein